MCTPAEEIIGRVAGRSYWFECSEDQQYSSAATNTVEQDWETWSGPTTYNPPEDSLLPFTAIKDNTEGISGVADLVFPSDAKLFLDVGGGRFHSVERWLKNQRKDSEYYVLDPFNRSREENIRVQRLILDRNVDVVLSISVLNVIHEENLRLEHISIAFLSLKENGFAYFKVWAGCWPFRGSGVGQISEEKKSFQANRWASAFEHEVKMIFGRGNVFCDNNLNLVVAQKRTT